MAVMGRARWRAAHRVHSVARTNDRASEAMSYDVICHLTTRYTIQDMDPSVKSEHWTAFLALISMLLTGCAGVETRSDSRVSETVQFDSQEVGNAPRGFTTALTGGGGPVAWVVREDPSAPGGKPVLVQESSDDTSYRFPLCIYDAVVARDVAVEVRFLPISGKVDQAGGIVLRYRPENYYIARANALEDNVNLFKTVRGKRTKMEEVPVKVTSGQWHTIRFEAKGRRLKVVFDGKTMIETDDASFSGPGKVGLWTKADSVSAFSNFKVETPSE